MLILQNENEILKRNYKILEREHKKSLSILKYKDETSETKNKNNSDSVKESVQVKDVDNEINKIIKDLQNEKSQSRNYKLLFKSENNTFDLLNNNLNESKIEMDKSIKFETEIVEKKNDKIRYMSPTVSSSFKIVQNKNKNIKNRNLEMQKFVSIKSKKQRSKSPVSNKKIKSPQKNLKNKTIEIIQNNDLSDSDDYNNDYIKLFNQIRKNKTLSLKPQNIISEPINNYTEKVNNEPENINKKITTEIKIKDNKEIVDKKKKLTSKQYIEYDDNLFNLIDRIKK